MFENKYYIQIFIRGLRQDYLEYENFLRNGKCLRLNWESFEKSMFSWYFLNFPNQQWSRNLSRSATERATNGNVKRRFSKNIRNFHIQLFSSSETFHNSNFLSHQRYLPTITSRFDWEAAVDKLIETNKMSQFWVFMAENSSENFSAKKVDFRLRGDPSSLWNREFVTDRRFLSTLIYFSSSLSWE